MRPHFSRTLRAIHGVSRKEDARFNEPQLTRNLERVVRLAAFAERHESTSRALAAAWLLPADQIDAILAAADLELADQDLTGMEGGA